MYVKIGEVGCFRLEFRKNPRRIPGEFRKNSGRIPEEFQKNSRRIPEEFQKNTVLCFADMKCSYLSADKMSSEFFNNSSQKKSRSPRNSFKNST